jgi:hypothetical protein
MDDLTYLQAQSRWFRAHLSRGGEILLLPRRVYALTTLSLSTPNPPIPSTNVHAQTLKFYWMDEGYSYTEEEAEEYARNDE